jgi:phospholipid/cholesterol/gamma-HCH transport system substrate-binding protein
MRRSVREAIVGFSLLAAITSAVGLSLWLRGLSLTRQFWTLEAHFQQADGVAVRSPVVYRGVMVGSVRSVQIRPEAVVAELEITNTSLRLPRTTVAEIGQVSLLGGEAQVALMSQGAAPAANAPSPRSSACRQSTMLCNGSRISGSEGSSLSSLTSLMHSLLLQVEKEQVVSKFATVATNIDTTAKQANAFLQEGRGLMADGKGLIQNLDQSVERLQPGITDINASSAHLRQLLAALDQPKVVNELRRTVANAERLTAQWEAVGGDVQKLTADPAFMEGVRSVAVGLGMFFDELYPAQTGAAKEREQRQQAGAAGPVAPATAPAKP